MRCWSRAQKLRPSCCGGFTAPETAGTFYLKQTREDPDELKVMWDEPEKDVLQSHGNEKDATEHGAYAVAIALADHLGFKVIARARQGSGSDWVMVRKGEPENDYYKLEVSGISRINTQKPDVRLAEKVTQGSGGDWDRPGMAVVARFEDVQVLAEGWV